MWVVKWVAAVSEDLGLGIYTEKWSLHYIWSELMGYAYGSQYLILYN